MGASLFIQFILVCHIILVFYLTYIVTYIVYILQPPFLVTSMQNM